MSFLSQAKEMLLQWKINQAQEYLMKIVYDQFLSEEDLQFNLRIVDESVKLAQDLEEIWTSKDFQKMFKIVQEY